MQKSILVFLTIALLALPVAVHADDEDAPVPLPKSVQSHVSAPLQPVGSGTYRKFGFRIYQVTLWAKNRKWDPVRSFALQLCYDRGLSKDTIVDTVMDDIREQNVADQATLTRWHAQLDQALPAVEDGDVLIGLSIPGKKSQLFYNGARIATIDDAALSKAFFAIWLGAGADRDLRSELLGHGDQ